MPVARAYPRHRALALLTAAASLSALVAVPIAAEAAAAATPTCFGQEATIVGTMGDDVIVGTPGHDVIVARAGDDVIYGLSGKDRICAGAGDDEVRAGLGGDWVDGGRGDDVLGGHWGDDKLFGREGSDKLLGHLGDDRVVGGQGTDRCFQLGGSGAVLGCERADLSVTVSGPKRTRTRETTFIVTVSNDGPSAADYWLTLSQSTNNVDCIAPSWAGTQRVAPLAAGSERVIEVTTSCVRVGKKPRVFVEAEVGSLAPDPDTSDNADQHGTRVRFKG